MCEVMSLVVDMKERMSGQEEKVRMRWMSSGGSARSDMLIPDSNFGVRWRIEHDK